MKNQKKKISLTIYVIALMIMVAVIGVLVFIIFQKDNKAEKEANTNNSINIEDAKKNQVKQDEKIKDKLLNSDEDYVEINDYEINKYIYKSNNSEEFKEDYEAMSVDELDKLLCSFNIEDDLKDSLIAETSCDNIEEAIEIAKDYIEKYSIKISNKIYIKVETETQYYYSIYYSYIKDNENQENESNGRIIVLKNDAINIENKKLNMNNIEKAKDIQEILDIYLLNKGIIDSSIKEDDDKYIYTFYSKSRVGGFVDVSEEGPEVSPSYICLCKDTIEINHNNGKYIWGEKKYIKELNYDPDKEVIFKSPER